VNEENALSRWDLHANQICTLGGRLGFKKNLLEFLAYSVELESGRVFDKLGGKYVKKPETLYVILSHYAEAHAVEEVGELIRFRDLPGGYAYEGAFAKRAAAPIAETFGHKPGMLLEAAKVLSGIKAEYGDASTKIPALPKVPITYILRKADEEFSATCTVLFDASASHYLPTEDIAVLTETTTIRLKSSYERLLPTGSSV
jgi:hypothetical protein